MNTGPQSRHCGRPQKVFLPIALLGMDANWTSELDFLKSHPEHLAEGNAMGFISDNGGEEYNLCHCESSIPILPAAIRTNLGHLTVWSNFEVANMDFWRAPAYTAYVDYLEASGGFYYEVRTAPFPPPLDIYSTRDSLAMG